MSSLPVVIPHTTRRPVCRRCLPLFPVPHAAAAVGSGTDAVELPMRALSLPPQCGVLLPAIAPCATAWAVLRSGLRPVLAGAGLVTAMPSPSAVTRAVRACGRPGTTVALHYAGKPAPVAGAAGLPLHRVAGTLHPRWVPARMATRPDRVHRLPVPASAPPRTCREGRGGMMTTEDARLAERIRRARPDGLHAAALQPPRRDGARRGGRTARSACMTDVQAAAGRAQLPHLRDWQRWREVIAARHTAALHRLRGWSIRLLPRTAAMPGTCTCCMSWRSSGPGGSRRLPLWLSGVPAVPSTSRRSTTWRTFGQTAQSPPDGLPGADSASDRCCLCRCTRRCQRLPQTSSVPGSPGSPLWRAVAPLRNHGASPGTQETAALVAETVIP
ncbi:DegT/DnrJ/EryC1/StrS family aminotransferase [Streptomyces sp. NPDC001774]